jgi:hypothetical protein
VRALEGLPSWPIVGDSALLVFAGQGQMRQLRDLHEGPPRDRGHVSVLGLPSPTGHTLKANRCRPPLKGQRRLLSDSGRIAGRKIGPARGADQRVLDGAEPRLPDPLGWLAMLANPIIQYWVIRAERYTLGFGGWGTGNQWR